MSWILSPIGLKVLGGVAILAVLGFGLRYCTNQAWHEGHKQGEFYGAEELTKKKKVEWQSQEDAIKARAAEVAAQEFQASELRAAMRKDYERSVAGLRKDLETAQRDNANIPADKLDPAIIERLDSLRNR